MHTRFRTLLLAFGALSAAPAALAQAAPPAPAQAKPLPPAAPVAPQPQPAAPKPTPAAAPPASADAPVAAPAEPTEPGEAAEAPEPDPELEPGSDLPPAAPAPAPAVTALPAWPQPSADASALEGMGKERPATARRSEGESDVFAEEWWTNARPVLELHGNFRFRAELFYRFSLGRREAPETILWPRPAGVPYTDVTGSARNQEKLCTAEEAGSGSDDNPDNAVNCSGNTQRGANLRFRLNPEVHVSDNLRLVSQIDLLENVVLGSTPTRANGAAFSFGSDTIEPPASGSNSIRDSIAVKRVWGEFATPVGELRFGRMPNHWGLGMLYNSGDGHDDDFQSTIDRLQFVTGIKPLELYVSAAWDFPSEGLVSDEGSTRTGQAFDLGQLDDVNQYTFSVARQKSPELQRLALSRGELVLNAGLQLTYRQQLLANRPPDPEQGPGFVRRDAYSWVPDLWVQLLYKQFRFEVEAATIQGSIANLAVENGDGAAVAEEDDAYTLRQWGIAAELEQRLAEERLQLGFGFGWASGDADEQSLTPLNDPTYAATQGQLGNDRDLETFRFNPSYRFDLILHRNLLSRVQGTYYFRPSIGYDFVREPTGTRLGGSVAAIWSRASEFVQSPGHARDLGLELNGAIYFQSKDGALNDDPSAMGGFFAKLEYGLLFPMAGLGYADEEAQLINSQLRRSNAADTSSAQILRLYLGIFF